MSNTSLLGSFGGQDNSALMFRNVLVNGCFRVWQRGTNQTTDGYGSDDRWLNGNNGSTKTHSQQLFTLGQTDVPGNPQFFSRTVVSSVAGANNFVAKYQRIESVRTLAGQTATLSFWAKADAPKNIAVEFSQSFGTGGSPSAGILSIGVTTIALTSSWRYYTVTVNIPSISGKTVGTTDDGYLQLLFWFDAGSNLNARTNSLGQQSGTFDIAMVQMEAGPVATPFERRPIGVEENLCFRYYQRISNFNINHEYPIYYSATNTFFIEFPLCQKMRPHKSASNLADNQYTGSSAPTAGTQWTFMQSGNAYIAKSAGTWVFTSIQSAGTPAAHNRLTIRVTGGTPSAVINAVVFGPAVYFEADAEL